MKIFVTVRMNLIGTKKRDLIVPITYYISYHILISYLPFSYRSRVHFKRRAAGLSKVTLILKIIKCEIGQESGCFRYICLLTSQYLSFIYRTIS